MIEYWKYRARLVKLFRQKEKTRAAFAERIRKARKDGRPGDEIKTLEYDSYFEAMSRLGIGSDLGNYLR